MLILILSIGVIYKIDPSFFNKNPPPPLPYTLRIILINANNPNQEVNEPIWLDGVQVGVEEATMTVSPGIHTVCGGTLNSCVEYDTSTMGRGLTTIDMEIYP